MWMGATEAARDLNVDARQVRRLLASGELPGRRVGNVWLVDSGAVRDRQLRNPHAGRPLSEAMAWGAAALLARYPAGVVMDWAEHPVLNRRDFRRLQQLLADPPPVEQWPQWMRNLAERHRLRVHPGVLERFVGDARVYRIDPSPLLGLSGVQPRLYAANDDFRGLLADYRAKPDPEGNGDLHVFGNAGAEVLARCPEALAVAAVVDLVASPNARERHAASQLLADAASHPTSEDP